MKKNHHRIIGGATLMTLFLISNVWADKIFFKNGFKTEGDVKYTEEGVWVDGGLFKSGEIDRIEKSDVIKTKDDKSWFSSVMEKTGMVKPNSTNDDLEKKKRETLQAYQKRMQSGDKKNQDGFVQSPQMMSPTMAAGAGQAQSNPMQLLMQAVAAQNAAGQQQNAANPGMEGMMQQAVMMQQQAQQKQMQVQEQIRQAAMEEEAPYEIIDSSAGQVASSGLPTYDSGRSKKYGDNYERDSKEQYKKKESRWGDHSEFGTTMKFDEETGEMKWEKK